MLNRAKISSAKSSLNINYFGKTRLYNHYLEGARDFTMCQPEMKSDKEK
jgi:hypothetical protein